MGDGSAKLWWTQTRIVANRSATARDDGRGDQPRRVVSAEYRAEAARGVCHDGRVAISDWLRGDHVAGDRRVNRIHNTAIVQL